MGQKHSTPVFLKWFTLPCTRSFDKCAMRGWIGLTACFLKSTHLDLMLRKIFRSPITPECCWIKRLTFSVPSWWLSSCICINIRTTAECLAEVRVGSFKSSLIVALLNRPFNRFVWWLSTNRESFVKSFFTFSSLLFSCHLQDQHFGLLSFHCCHNVVFIYVKDSQQFNHSHVFAKPVPNYDALCRSSHQSKIVIINWFCLLWPANLALFKTGGPILSFVF